MTYVAASIGCAMGDNTNNFKDGKDLGIIYITNSTPNDLYLRSANLSNKSGYSSFNCIYPIPKDKQIIPSPPFETIHINQVDYQVALIKSGSSVMYAFNSRCDSKKNKMQQESFDLIYANSIADKFVKVAIVFMFMHINKQVHELDYTKAISPEYAIYGNILSSGFGIKPWHLTVLTSDQ